MLTPRQVEALWFIINENKRAMQLLASVIASSAGEQEVIRNFALPCMPVDLNLQVHLELLRAQNDELQFAHHQQLFPGIHERIEALNNHAVSPQPEGLEAAA